MKNGRKINLLYRRTIRTGPSIRGHAVQKESLENGKQKIRVERRRDVVYFRYLFSTTTRAPKSVKIESSIRLKLNLNLNLQQQKYTQLYPLITSGPSLSSIFLGRCSSYDS